MLTIFATSVVCVALWYASVWYVTGITQLAIFTIAVPGCRKKHRLGFAVLQDAKANILALH